MNDLGVEEYRRLVAEGRIVNKDRRGPKVIERPDGLFLKIFRRRSIFSSDILTPYALRFQRNARRLAQLGIETVEVRELFFCPALKEHLVLYRPLTGNTLREALAADGRREGLVGHFASYLARLHETGVFFRSLHFGNVVLSPAGDSFGLIDVSDMKILARRLPVWKRLRNFQHLIRYPEDRARIEAFGTGLFLHRYLEATSLGDEEKDSFSNRLRKEIPFFAVDPH
ncbi:MAG: toluene tolerance protein [Deltaproteobacteria bacterium]|nr:toluene tolerance protein [Deltaproteobacteria bacterium]